MGFIKLGGKRKKSELLDALYIYTIANSGDEKAIKKATRELLSDR